MQELSAPLNELPTFLATISMVVDDEREIIKGLKHAEHKSPARYDAARQIFIRILTGDLSCEFGVAQALKISDPTERECAASVLRVAKSFLEAQAPCRLERLPLMIATLPNGLEIKVGPAWIRHFDEERLLVLHFWQSALSARQLSAAAAILRLALRQRLPRYAPLEIDFVSVAIPDHSESRKFRSYGWMQLAPLDESELLKFSQQLASAWAAYQMTGPREIKRRPRQRGLFD